MGYKALFFTDSLFQRISNVDSWGKTLAAIQPIWIFLIIRMNPQNTNQLFIFVHRSKTKTTMPVNRLKKLLYSALFFFSLLTIVQGQTYKIQGLKQFPAEFGSDLNLKNGKLFHVDIFNGLRVFSPSGILLRHQIPSVAIDYYSMPYYDYIDYFPINSVVSPKEDACIWFRGILEGFFCGLGAPYYDTRKAIIFQKDSSAKPIYLSPPAVGSDPMGDYYVYPDENFGFSSRGRLVSSTVNYFTSGWYPISQKTIQSRGIGSNLVWQKKFNRLKDLSPHAFCTDQNEVFRTYVTDPDTFLLDSQWVYIPNNHYTQLRFDSAGNLLFNQIHDFARPKSSLLPVQDRGVLEMARISDSLSGYATGMHLTFKNRSGIIQWSKAIQLFRPDLYQLPKVISDSSGIFLLETKEQSIGSGFMGYPLSRNHYTYRIKELDYNGQLVFEDTSLKVFSRKPPMPRIHRLDSNRLVLSLVSDSMVSFRGQSYFMNSTAPNASENFLFLLHKNPDTLAFYQLSTELCGQDSIRIPVLGFPDGLDQYRVELSDSSGNFTNPLVLATGSTTSVWIKMPPELQNGDGYKIRIFSFNQNQFSPNYDVKIRYRRSVSAPIISALGSTDICAGNSVRVAGESQLPFSWSNKPFLVEGKDTLSISTDQTVYATTRFGSCQAHSDTLSVHVLSAFMPDFSLVPNSVCLNSGYVQLPASYDTMGKWISPLLVNQNYLQPDTVEGTITLRFQNLRYPQCPIDTAFSIQMVRNPFLPEIRDSLVCLGGSLNLKKLHMTDTYFQGQTEHLQDSIFNASVPGHFGITCRRVVGGCTTDRYFNIYVPPTEELTCQTLDSTPEMGLILPNFSCTGSSNRIFLKNQQTDLSHIHSLKLEISDLNGNFSQPTVAGYFNFRPYNTLYVSSTLPEGDYAYQLRLLPIDSVISYPGLTFRVRKSPEIPTVFTSGPREFCEGLVSPGPTSFYLQPLLGTNTRWTTDSSVFFGDTLQPVPGKTYQVARQNASCTGPFRTVSFPIIPKRIPILSTPNEICVPSPPVSLVSNFTNAVWTGPNVNQFTKKFTPPLANDSVWIRMRASYGSFNFSNCLADTQFLFRIRIKPQIPAVLDTFFCANQPWTGLPYGQWQNLWSGSGLTSGPNYYPTGNSGQDTLFVTSTNDFCTGSGQIRIQLPEAQDSLCLQTGLSDLKVLEKGDLQVFPNPNSGQFQIRAQGEILHSKVELRDGLGRLVWEGNPESGWVRIGDLAPGMYWLHAHGFGVKPVQIR
jgi:hypothetical protein